MENARKNIISLEKCKKDLKHSAKGDLFFDTVILAGLLIVFIPLFFLGIYLAKSIFVLGFLLSVFGTVPPAFYIYYVIRDIGVIRLIDRGGFSVVKDTVWNLVKDEPLGRSTADAIYFNDNGKFFPGQTVFDLTSVGDEFYLVILHTKKKKISFAFHTMMYELI